MTTPPSDGPVFAFPDLDLGDLAAARMRLDAMADFLDATTPTPDERDFTIVPDLTRAGVAPPPGRIPHRALYSAPDSAESLLLSLGMPAGRMPVVSYDLNASMPLRKTLSIRHEIVRTWSNVPLPEEPGHAVAERLRTLARAMDRTAAEARLGCSPTSGYPNSLALSNDRLRHAAAVLFCAHADRIPAGGSLSVSVIASTSGIEEARLIHRTMTRETWTPAFAPEALTSLGQLCTPQAKLSLQSKTRTCYTFSAIDIGGLALHGDADPVDALRTLASLPPLTGDPIAQGARDMLASLTS